MTAPRDKPTGGGGHTAGPFEYRSDRTIAAAGQPLARCYADRNAEANGPLFAAAPDLLRALQALVPTDFDQHPDDFAEEWHEARAAIARATGGQ